MTKTILLICLILLSIFLIGCKHSTGEAGFMDQRRFEPGPIQPARQQLVTVQPVYQQARNIADIPAPFERSR